MSRDELENAIRSQMMSHNLHMGLMLEIGQDLQKKPTNSHPQDPQKEIASLLQNIHDSYHQEGKNDEYKVFMKSCLQTVLGKDIDHSTLADLVAAANDKVVNVNPAHSKFSMFNQSSITNTESVTETTNKSGPKP